LNIDDGGGISADGIKCGMSHMKHVTIAHNDIQR
jgi:hypothetical protein